MNLYRLDDSGARVPFNVVELPKKAKRTTPTPTFLPPTMHEEPPAAPVRDRSSDMIGYVIIVTLCGLWFAAGFIVRGWVR